MAAANDNIQNAVPPPKIEIPTVGPKRGYSGVRILRGHKGSITALHAVTRREVHPGFAPPKNYLPHLPAKDRKFRFAANL